MVRKLHHAHHGFHKRHPEAIAIPQSISLETMIERSLSKLPSLVKRSSSGSESTGCSPDDSSPKCEKPSDAKSVTLPVVLAVVIPIVVAIIIFIVLHRKHVKKLRQEDANDPHKSLDFGWDPNSTPRKGRNKNKNKGPEMSVTDMGAEKGSCRQRGMSMDMDLPSPYLLPPGLSGSRESLHSMSRTVHSQDDRYRPATTYIPNDSTSPPSYKSGRKGTDDSSSDAGSGSYKRGPRDDMKQNLLGNAQRMSRSMPPSNRSPVPEIRMPDAAKEQPRKALPSDPQSAGLSPNFPLLDSRGSYVGKDDAAFRKSNNYLGAFIHSRDPSAEVVSQKSEYATPNEPPSTPAPTILQNPSRKSPPPSINTSQPEAAKQPQPSIEMEATAPRPPRKQSLRVSEQAQHENLLDDSSDYGDGLKVTPPSPHGTQPQQYEINRRSSQAYLSQIDEFTHGAANLNDVGYDVRRLSMGVRPLPRDDPTDNPEQRANRIRSFYKEYFDESKPGAMQPAGGYYEDYDQEYLGDGAIFDPVSGQFVSAQAQRPEQRGRPFAEPIGRRAMTPPPRAPPRFARQHAATLSGGGRMMPPGPRAFSSGSGHFGPSGRGVPKKQLPPPMPLNVLPTPHMLKDDSFAIFNSMDFAPPTSARDRQAGRPESPRGGLRPYSPMVPAHMPLQSSFDDLAAMPSP